MHIVATLASIALGVVVARLYSYVVVRPVTKRWGTPAGHVAHLLFLAAALVVIVATVR